MMIEKANAPLLDPISCVTPGLDPGVHTDAPRARHRRMDCRVKPGNDGCESVSRVQ
jgi:hypothetical protein